MADIFAINKADLEGSLRVKAELRAMLGATNGGSAGRCSPVILTEALYGRGVDEVAAAMQTHHDFLVAHGGLETRRRQRAGLELAEAMESAVREYVASGLDGASHERLIDELVDIRISPHAAASAIVGMVARTGLH